jgi:hypothetical protein
MKKKTYKRIAMNIKEKFLELTSRTYPHGTEEDVFPLLNSELQKDEFGNLFIKIGESDVMFTSHLDTATSALTAVNHVFDGNIIKTDGKSILGADDKAGVTIMLYMIENKIPGLYYFFLGEEVGCVGSRKVANVQKDKKIEGINKVISFDRRGNDSVITFQSSQRCCSDIFGEALSKQLNLADDTFSYKNDPTGILTDSIQFIKIYSECTNISVGYKSEHTFTEQQDIEHLTKLAEACLLVDWNGLPVDRDPSKTEYKSYGGYGGYHGWDDDYDYYPSNSRWGNNITKKPEPKTEKVWFHDKKYNYVSNVEINSLTKKVVSVDLCKERITYEKMIIDDLLISLDLSYNDFTWDGFKLNIFYKQDAGDHKTECDRNDLLEYLSELDYSKGYDLGDSDIDDYFNSVSYKREQEKTRGEDLYRGYADFD